MRDMPVVMPYLPVISMATDRSDKPEGVEVNREVSSSTLWHF